MNSGDGMVQRRRRRSSIALPPGQSCYEWSAIVLLLVPSVVGMWWFGGVRIWLFAPLLICGMIAVALCALRPLVFRDVSRAQFPPGILPFGLFVAWAACLVPGSAVPHEARVEWLQLASVFLAYWAWTELASHHHRWRWILSVLILSVTVMAWYALIQEAHGSNIVLTTARPASYGMRASGSYFCPNHFANLMEMFFPLCLALMMCRASGFALRLFSGYAILVMLPALYLTQSRSGWIAFAAGAGVVIVLAAFRKSAKRMLAAGALVALAAAATAAVLWFASPMVRERILEARQGNMRIGMWQDTLLIIADQPWLGHGPGSFRWLFHHYNQHMKQYMNPEYAHNEFLQLVADHGLIGFAFMAAAVFLLFRRLLPLLRDPDREKESFLAIGLIGAIAACFVHACFDYNFHLFANNHTLIALAGIVAACLHGGGALKGVSPSPLGRWALATLGVAASLGVCVLTVQADISHRLFRKGETLRNEFALKEAEDRYRRAIRIDPGYWRPYLGMGDVMRRNSFWNRDPDEKKRQGDEALRLYREAAERNPWDNDPVHGMIKIHRKRGDDEAVLALLQEIVARSPRQAFFFTELGAQLEKMGRDADALKAFQRAQEIEPNEMSVWRIGEITSRMNAPATP